MFERGRGGNRLKGEKVTLILYLIHYTKIRDVYQFHFEVLKAMNKKGVSSLKPKNT